MSLDTSLKDLIQNIKKLADLPNHKDIIKNSYDAAKGACAGSTSLSVLQAEQIYISYTKLQTCDALEEELVSAIRTQMNAVKPYLLASEKPIEFYHLDEDSPYTVSLIDDEVIVNSDAINYPR